MALPSKIDRIVEGDWQRTMFSAETVNELIDAINAVLAMEGKGSTRVYKSDGKFIIWSGAVSGSGASTGSIVISGSSSTNIYCLSRYC